MDPLIGTQVDNYRIVDVIGDGGMGRVYRARDVLLERDVALKWLRTDLVRHDEFVDRFRAEAVTLARLRHPAIASLYGLHRHGDGFAMAMEFVEGERLDAVIARDAPVPAARAVAMALPILDALAYAHEQGVVHRDIKPANIILGPNGCKILDFGIARVLGADRRTQVGTLVGTVAYMAPEQIQGLDVDGRADVYAAAIVLYELLTGRVPFTGENDWAVMQAHVQQMPVPPRVYAERVPTAVENVLMRALAKQPADRYASAAEFRQALAAVVAADANANSTMASTPRPREPLDTAAHPAEPESEEVMTRGVGHPPRTAPQEGRAARRRSARVTGLILLTLLVAGAVALTWVVRHDGADPAQSHVPVSPSAPAAASHDASVPTTDEGTARTSATEVPVPYEPATRADGVQGTAAGTPQTASQPTAYGGVLLHVVEEGRAREVAAVLELRADVIRLRPLNMPTREIAYGTVRDASWGSLVVKKMVGSDVQHVLWLTMSDARMRVRLDPKNYTAIIDDLGRRLGRPVTNRGMLSEADFREDPSR